MKITVHAKRIYISKDKVFGLGAEQTLGFYDFDSGILTITYHGLKHAHILVKALGEALDKNCIALPSPDKITVEAYYKKPVD